MKTITRLLAIFMVAACTLSAFGAIAQQSPRYIYLTFDDGPLKGSQKIDSIVMIEQVKINVFVIGQVMAQSTLLKSYFQLYENNPYIEIYNHSYTHAKGNYTAYYKNPRGVLEDMIKNETEFDLPYKIVRLPGANNWRVGERKHDISKSSAQAADLLASEGYKVFGWDMEWNRSAKTGDPTESAEELLKEIETLFEAGKTFTPDHLVVLIHDPMFRKSWAQSELKKLIDSLQERGFIFEHLRNYPENPAAMLSTAYRYRIFSSSIKRLNNWLAY